MYEIYCVKFVSWWLYYYVKRRIVNIVSEMKSEIINVLNTTAVLFDEKNLTKGSAVFIIVFNNKIHLFQVTKPIIIKINNSLAKNVHRCSRI